MLSLAIFQEIFSRYVEKSHPATSTLVPLYFPEEPLNSPEDLSSTTAPTPLKSTSNSQSISLPSAPVKERTTPTSPSSPTKSKDPQHSWPCVPIYPGLSHEELLKENYPALKRYIQRPARAYCGILVHETQENEILFFNRLAKILSQKLFPSRLVLFHQKIFSDFSHFPHPFCLAPLPIIGYKNSQIKYHNPISQDKVTCVPIYSSSQYTKDSELKRDLWTILTHLSASTQKS
ncbi:hypothetical protein [Chlamydia sp.]|uniref:hypothetical protein n=1 Tax=Chlamydia sp. TaxID=35827 RepID=UPI0025C223B3|nr:hypothetical protein [Chlamydia sp.]MBQ8498575.1 hypothetical protein [Chlamydia sp.]